MMLQNAVTPPDSPVSQWAVYYAQQWGAIPILLHSIVNIQNVYDSDVGAYVPKPFCSCKKGGNCPNPGKHPIVGHRQKPMSTPKEGLQTAQEILRSYPRSALALRTGPESGIFVLDVDVRHNKRGDVNLQKSLEAAGVPLNYVFGTLLQYSGGGGFHLVFKYPKGRRIPSVTNHPRLGDGVDVKAEGGMFNVSPSLHKSGNFYHWPNGCNYGQILEAPGELLDLIEKKEDFDREVQGGLEPHTPDREELLELAATLKKRKREKKKEMGRNLHDALHGKAIFPHGGAHDGFRDMMYEVAMKWPMCDSQVVVDLFEECLDARASDNPDASTDATNLIDSLETAKVKALEFWRSWKAKMRANADGVPIACVANYKMILENDPEISGKLYYDTRAKLPSISADIGEEELGGLFPRALDDEDFTALHGWMEQRYKFTIAREKAFQKTVELVGSRAEKRDPFRDWILQLRGTWDQHPRLETLLQELAGTEDGLWPRTVFPIWMRGFVRRILEPGYKNDTMLILEGAQGYRKSTFFRYLVPSPELFNDSCHKLSQDEAVLRQLHAGPAIHEIGELAGFSRSSLQELKAFLSASTDQVRQLYKKPAMVPRNFVFVGTTNDAEYLQDATGLRRFLPVEVLRPIDTQKVLQWRNQLYAEALWGLELGMPDYFTNEILEPFKELQNARREVDPWVPVIQAYLDTPQKDTYCGLTETSVNSILQHLQFELKDLSIRDHRRVARCLTMLDWKRSRTSTGLRVWRRQGTPPIQTPGAASEKASGFGAN